MTAKRDLVGQMKAEAIDTPSASQGDGWHGYEQAAAFRAALARFSRRTDEICQRHGLTPDQYTLLLMVRGSPSGLERTTVKELSGRLQLSASGITERLRRAETAGLVRRERSRDDRRVVYFYVTERANDLLLAAYTDMRADIKLVQALEEALGAFEHEQLGRQSSSSLPGRMVRRIRPHPANELKSDVASDTAD